MAGKGEDSKDKLEREEYIKEGMKNNYGIYMIMSGMYIGYKWISILYISLYAFHIPLLLVTIYICKDDFTVVSEDGHFIILLTLTFSTLLSHLFNREKIDNIFEAMGRKYYDYEETLDPGTLERISKIQDESTARKQWMKRVFYVGVGSALVAVAVGRPILQYYLSELVINKELPAGVDGSKNTFIYYPWGVTNIYIRIFEYFLQDLFTLMTASSVLGIDLVFYNMGESISEQLGTLGVSLRRLQHRAAHVALKNDEIAKGRHAFIRSMHVCLKHSIKHHQLIIKIFADFKAVFYVALLWLVMGATFLLCMAGVVFTSDVPVVSKGTFASIITAELMHTYLLCWSGEQIAHLSANLPWDLYCNDWFGHSSEIMVYHRMLAMRCTQPLQLTAGGFTNINRNTFLEVVRTAFSYINLLQASNSRTARIDGKD
ncbi:Odorant receptor [Nesidiocoris tenuis]|uniref:Odorant receptor n=1 Tax=Nesidiocoris tenuis TaxID=355587 RepID=A0ABN7BFH7_9HEMI|nr:Odorant receptor [Nesidiocoris tenuis]